MDTPESQNMGASSVPSAPPSPQEVKVRTMKSDLASMAASGGGLPQFQNVKIAAPALAQQATRGPQDKSNLLLAIVVIVAFLVLAAVVYVAYTTTQKNTPVQAPAATGQ